MSNLQHPIVDTRDVATPLFGVFIPQGWKMELASIDGAAAKWQKAVDIAVLSEQLGYDSVWVYDHFHNVPKAAHEEWQVLVRRMERREEAQVVRTVADALTLLAMQAAVETVMVDEDVSRYCVDLAVATRRHPHVQLGASPRGALALLLCSRAHAVIAGRDYVTPEDVKAVAPSVLPHRITVKPELWLTKASGATVTAEVLSSVPTPTPGRVDRG